jgi:hypothetical protein
MKKYANAIGIVAVQLRRIGCIGLLLLIGCAFCLDVFHGIKLGQDRAAFHPIYRLRQSLAVAISRMHDPSPGRYLAYKSVVNVLNENGFAHLDAPGWTMLLNDGPLLDRIIQQAIDVPIDTSLPPEIIQANELGYADYAYFSFRLFGDKISSLYYFFYLIVGLTCLLYVLQFRDSPFLLFLVVIFLAELHFLENYAHSFGQNTVSNSRLFSGLSLVPVLHILFLLWQCQPPRAFTVTAVVVQSAIFAFLLSCRTEVAWQVAMIAVVACGIGLSLLLRRRDAKHRHLIVLAPVWPAVIFLLVVFAYSAVVSTSADQRYATEPKAHIVWHEFMIGLLRSSLELRREYLGGAPLGSDDGEVYTAVIHDLNARNDFSSPIVKRLGDGQLTIDLMGGWAEYDRLVRSLAFRIMRDHPLVLFDTVPVKIRQQIDMYEMVFENGMRLSDLRAPIILIVAGALICMGAGGFTVGAAMAVSAAGVIAIILMFAAATPMVEPSVLSIGTLFSYLGVVAILVPYAAMLLIRAIVGAKSKAEGVSLDAESLR